MSTASLYPEIYERSMRDPDGFWGEAAEAIHWHKRWDRVLDLSAGPSGRWFVGGEVNTCYNALDRWVEAGRGDQKALIYDSPVTGKTRSFTYTELLDRTSRLASVLLSLGVEKGDRVLLYLPMVPQAVVGTL